MLRVLALAVLCSLGALGALVSGCDLYDTTTRDPSEAPTPSDPPIYRAARVELVAADEAACETRSIATVDARVVDGRVDAALASLRSRAADLRADKILSLHFEHGPDGATIEGVSGIAARCEGKQD